MICPQHKKKVSIFLHSHNHYNTKSQAERWKIPVLGWLKLWAGVELLIASIKMLRVYVYVTGANFSLYLSLPKQLRLLLLANDFISISHLVIICDMKLIYACLHAFPFTMHQVHKGDDRLGKPLNMAKRRFHFVLSCWFPWDIKEWF